MYHVRPQGVGERMINLHYYYYINKNWQPCHSLDSIKHCPMLIGKGSAALAAAMPYPGKAT